VLVEIGGKRLPVVVAETARRGGIRRISWHDEASRTIGGLHMSCRSCEDWRAGRSGIGSEQPSQELPVQLTCCSFPFGSVTVGFVPVGEVSLTEILLLDQI